MRVKQAIRPHRPVDEDGGDQAFFAAATPRAAFFLSFRAFFEANAASFMVTAMGFIR